MYVLRISAKFQWCGLRLSVLGQNWSETKKKSVLVLVLQVWCCVVKHGLATLVVIMILKDTATFQVLFIMDARSASVHIIFCPCFFHIFFIPALVGQTAERIFTKLSHVVDIRHHLRTYVDQFIPGPPETTRWAKKWRNLAYFWPHPYLFSSHARTRQNIAILKKTGSPR